MANVLKCGDMDLLISRLIAGDSIREAARVVGCARNTAQRYRYMLDEFDIEDRGFTTRRTGKRKKDGSFQLLKVVEIQRVHPNTERVPVGE